MGNEVEDILMPKVRVRNDEDVCHGMVELVGYAPTIRRCKRRVFLIIPQPQVILWASMTKLNKPIRHQSISDVAEHGHYNKAFRDCRERHCHDYHLYDGQPREILDALDSLRNGQAETFGNCRVLFLFHNDWVVFQDNFRRDSVLRLCTFVNKNVTHVLI